MEHGWEKHQAVAKELGYNFVSAEKVFEKEFMIV